VGAWNLSVRRPRHIVAQGQESGVQPDPRTARTVYVEALSVAPVSDEGCSACVHAPLNGPVASYIGVSSQTRRREYHLAKSVCFNRKQGNCVQWAVSKSADSTIDPLASASLAQDRSRAEVASDLRTLSAGFFAVIGDTNHEEKDAIQPTRG